MMSNTFLLISVLALLSCSSKSEVNGSAESSQIKTTVFEDEKYYIEYPSNWVFKQTPDSIGMRFVIGGPLDSEKDDFRENLNLLVVDLMGSGMTLSDYVKYSEEGIKSQIEGYLFESSNLISVDDDVHHNFVYFGILNDQEVTFVQHYRVLHDRAYVLSFISRKNESNFKRKVGENILNSFKLKQTH